MATENMVKAGRAGLTFGGDWNESVEYERIVGVRYDNKLFFSKKPVPIGTIPEDGEFWFLAYEGLTDSEWEGLLNGTQQVGDSAKLGGKDASKYITTEGGEIKSTKNTPLKLNVITGGSLVVLQEFLANDKSYGHLGFDGVNSPIFRSTDANYYKLLHTGNMADHVLPLSGGTVNSVDFGEALTILRNASSSSAALKYKNGDGVLGYLGFDYNGTPNYWSTDKTAYQLLHTGNKPTGTYTGNGDATERTINIGGIGGMVAIYSSVNKIMAVVTAGGAFCPDSNNNIIFNKSARIIGINSSVQLVLNTDHFALNRNGDTYGYAVL